MNKLIGRSSFLSTSVLLLFILSGAAITFFARYTGIYNEITDNYNLMWLDVWSLLFTIVIVLLWKYTPSVNWRSAFVLTVLALFGVVALSLIFAEATFPVHAYWGDQKFRMTMIQQFSTTSLPGDYYYKDLPVFYPPVLYYCLSLIARLFDMEAYQVLRIAPHIIFAVLPFLLYGLWRKILSVPRALFVTCVIMLVDVGGLFFSAKVPHAFIANSLFIPWWLHYLEGVGAQKKPYGSHWLFGSLIGALLFSTYFYPYFIIGFMLLMRTVYAVLQRKERRQQLQTFLKSWGILAGAAVFSLPHWLPVFFSIMEHGMDRSRVDWYHSGTPGLNFFFLNFTWLGIFFLLSLIFFLRKHRSVVYQRILMLIGFILVFMLLGSILQAMDRSPNLTKVRDFVVALAGPTIGLGLFALYRWSGIRPKMKWVAFGVLLTFLLIMVQGMNTLFRDGTVVEAKKSVVPNWGIPQNEIDNCRHSIFLSANEEFFAFFPAYSFIAINEHYSHPASRFIQRYDFLNLLQRVRDPFMLNLALKQNIFDRVDYLMPDRKADTFVFRTSISNYPDKLVSKTLTYPCTLLENNRYFRRFASERYLFEALPVGQNAQRMELQAATASDSASQLNDLFLFYNRLNEDGKKQFTAYIGEHSFEHENLQQRPEGYWFEDRLVLIGCHSFSTPDSVYFFPTFRVNRELLETWRVYLHLYLDSDRKTQINVDFPVDVTTEEWTTGELVTLCRVFPRPKSPYNVILGFFNANGQYGDGFSAHVPLMK